jgi:hypothetical protein
MGDGRWAMGDGRWAMGDGRWAMMCGGDFFLLALRTILAKQGSEKLRVGGTMSIEIPN